MNLKLKHQSLTTAFRLYQTNQSKGQTSFFDLIDGDTETKQTKGLALILKHNPALIERLLNVHEVKRALVDILGSQVKQFIQSDYISVDAEMLGLGDVKIRRDITLTFYSRGIKQLILVIEAKSAKLDRVDGIEQQLRQYFDPLQFPGDVGVPALGLTLTKYKQWFSQGTNFISLTWMDIIMMLHENLAKSTFDSHMNLLRDFFQFITGVDKHMRFFEKEVLSVAAGSTYELIESSNIHSCPNTKGFRYKQSLFITFRSAGGGEMRKLYGIDDVLILNPTDDTQLMMIAQSGHPRADHLLAYIADRKKVLNFDQNTEYRFYLLSQTNQIELKHGPKPPKNNAGGWYYKISELLSGKQVVEVDA